MRPWVALSEGVRVLLMGIVLCAATACGDSSVPPDVASSSKRSLVLDYQDFGPPSMATPLLGPEWWQWEAHGDSEPRAYDVRVVVFSGGSEAEIAAEFPVIEDRLQDYRYVAYQDAMSYLNVHIQEDAVPVITQRLIATRDHIQAGLE